MILPVGNAQLFVDQIFRIFDKDGNGTIDFKVSFFIAFQTGESLAKLHVLNAQFLSSFLKHHFGVDAIYLVMFSGLVL